MQPDKPGRGCEKYRPAPTSAPSCSWNRVNRIGQTIERANGGTYRQIRNVQVPGRGLQVTMPHQNLNAAQIGRLLQQVGGKAVAQGMGRYQFGQVGGGTRVVADAPDRCLCDGALGIASWEEPGPGSVAFPVGPQRRPHPRRDPPLALFV